MRRLVTLALAAVFVAVGIVLPRAGPVSAATTTWYEQFTSSNAGSTVYGSNQRFQTFTPTVPHEFNWISLYLYKMGSPTYTVNISLYNVDSITHLPTGTVPLCNTAFAASSLTTTATWYEFQFSLGYDLMAGTEYAIVLSGNGGASSSTVIVKVNTAGGYSRGLRGYSADSGTTWIAQSSQDMAFKEGGVLTHAVVTMTAPSAVSFGTFHMGWNIAASATPGKVTVTPGLSGLTVWTVTARAGSPFLGSAGDSLTNPVLIGPNSSLEPWADWRIADGSAGTVDGHSFDDEALTYSGTTGTADIPFSAAQFIESSDLKQGTYTTIITFTATCQP